ncbi:MAG: hypothetical protein KBC21_02245 [Candidatus Pacebacteria bacterium]|jgi:hypothetical protein|nr:hypothetical protein [Candidatus Paceibacterota bacterium]
MKSAPSVTKKSRTSTLQRTSTAKKEAPKRIAKKSSSTILRRVKKQSKTLFRAALLSSSFQRSIKVIVGVVFVSSSLYGIYHLVGKTFANEVVISKSEIVSRVAKLTPLPVNEPYDVVRVEDGGSLQKQNEFYKEVKEGDYILMYKDVAVIYDLRNNTIVAMRRTLGEQKEEKIEENSSTTTTPTAVQGE